MKTWAAAFTVGARLCRAIIAQHSCAPTRNAAALLLALTLAGCAGAPPAPVRVEVPVAIPCPAPQPLPRPVLPIADLAPDAPDADVLRAVVASLEILTGYAQALERQLAGYAPAPKAP